MTQIPFKVCKNLLILIIPFCFSNFVYVCSMNIGTREEQCSLLILLRAETVYVIIVQKLFHIDIANCASIFMPTDLFFFLH